MYLNHIRQVIVNNDISNSVRLIRLKSLSYSCLRAIRCNHIHFGIMKEHIQLSSRDLKDFEKYKSRYFYSQKPYLETSENEMKELELTRKLFPEARVSLKELSDSLQMQIYNIFYKNDPNSGKDGWICTYVLCWPETKSFQSLGVTKKQAAEKAAAKALNWLYVTNKIDDKGLPTHFKKSQAELEKLLNDQQNNIIVDLGQEALNVEKLRNTYESKIKKIFKDAYELRSKKQQEITLGVDNVKIGGNETSNNDAISQSRINDASKTDPVLGIPQFEPSTLAVEARNSILKKRLTKYESNISHLPIEDCKDRIWSTIQASRVTIIVGSPGCGKSTRVPPLALRNGAKAKVIVTEPRRIAAMSLAQRVADELNENVGDTVGYQIRFKSRFPRPPGGSLLYCTTGILLKRLQANPGLEGCSHVFVDEAHERDINIDIALLMLKRALEMNDKLKIIVMSATIDPGVFTRYFPGSSVVDVPGKSYPVEQIYLDDICSRFEGKVKTPKLLNSCNSDKPTIIPEEIASVVEAIDKGEPEGAILVFLPGWFAIKDVQAVLQRIFADSKFHMILCLHSRLSMDNQEKVFRRPMPGVRKIVLATNIAETSVTIPDVVYVVDTGAIKETSLKAGTGKSSMGTRWVSTASAKQRAGRAGRVQPGKCYKLYTEKVESNFEPYTLPEILRVPLEQTVLECKSYDPGTKALDFFSQLLEPPAEETLKMAVSELIDIGALSRPDERLTRLGSVLSAFPLHPRMSAALVYAAPLGNVTSVATLVTHLSTNAELFKNAPDTMTEIISRKKQFHPTSDHVALCRLQEEYNELVEAGTGEEAHICTKYDLNEDSLKFSLWVSQELLTQLLDLDIVEKNADFKKLNRFALNDELLVATLFAGTNNLMTVRPTSSSKGPLRKVKKAFVGNNSRAVIGKESVNKERLDNVDEIDFLVYFGGFYSTERRALVVHNSSKISPEAVLLFCKDDVIVNMKGEDDLVSASIKRHNFQVKIKRDQVPLVLMLRLMVWDMLRYYVERDISHLEPHELEVDEFRSNLLQTILKLIRIDN